MDIKEHIKRLEGTNGFIGKNNGKWYRIWYTGLGSYTFDRFTEEIREELTTLADKGEIYFSKEYMYIPVYGPEDQVKTAVFEEWRLKEDE